MRFTSLQEWGWTNTHERNFRQIAASGHEPGRVLSADRGRCRLRLPGGERQAGVAHQVLLEAPPAVGDWAAADVLASEAVVKAILPRTSQFVRQAAGGTTRRQVLAANVDTAFLVTALTRDFNLRRIERYLVMAWESGARPVILLSKADLVEDPSPYIHQITEIAGLVPTHAVSSQTGCGLQDLETYLRPGQTIVLLGSSGVGKSTLVNRLLGGRSLETAPVRAKDGRGRHTTSRRRLLRLESGALVIDTPGLRELLPWDAGAGLEKTFQDIEKLAVQCRFADCAHDQEPSCAVRGAVEEGQLDAARLQNYLKLIKEQAYQARRRSDHEARVFKQSVKQQHRMYRQIMQHKKRRGR